MQLPEGFINRYKTLLGDEADAFLASYEIPAASGFRINPLRPSVNIDLSQDQPINYSQWGYVGNVDGNAIDHVSGYVYSQEPSAQVVGAVASPDPGMTVLDLCAAPGGKSTHLASAMGGTGVLVSNEINLGRARILASNVERFGITNAVVTSNDPDTLAAVLPDAFDMIVVDAPCSGEGMFRKDPDAMRFWTPDYAAACADRQRDILLATLKMLRPGGTLVYSTCTFAPEEDEQIIAWLLATTDLEMVAIDKLPGMSDARPEWADGNPAIAQAARLWPQNQLGEGHFVAKLRRPATDAVPRKPKKQRGNGNQKGQPSADQIALWKEWAATDLTTLPTGDLRVAGDQLFMLPKGTPKMNGIRVLRGGLHLGTFKKRRFEPSHSLATAIAPADFTVSVEVSAAEYAAYRHGDTLARPDTTGKHYVLLTFEGKGFALGRLVNGTIKNLYPKGLRV